MTEFVRLAMSSMLAIFGIMLAIIPTTRTWTKTGLSLSAFVASGVVFYHQVIANLSPWPSYTITLFLLFLLIATMQYGRAVTTMKAGRRHDDI